jgi:hypothetical protein
MPQRRVSVLSLATLRLDQGCVILAEGLDRIFHGGASIYLSTRLSAAKANCHETGLGGRTHLIMFDTFFGCPATFSENGRDFHAASGVVRRRTI